MLRQRFPVACFAVWVCALSAASIGAVVHAADQDNSPQAVEFRVGKPSQRLEMTVNTSQVIKLRRKIPRMFVADPAVVQATPLAPDEVQIAALTPGVTQVNLYDEDGQIISLDVMVSPDVAQLRKLLESEFPEASLRVRPLAKSVYITGYVPRSELVHEITTFAQDYYQDVRLGIVVGGVQQVALHVKVMEVSRTKLRQLGLDWRFLGDNLEVTQGAAGLYAQSAKPPGSEFDTLRFAVFGDVSQFLGYLQALRSQNLVKVLSEPTLVTMTGRPATFLSGGSLPVVLPGSLGTYTIEWREYGTRVDFVPMVLGNGLIRLEVRGSVSELDPTRGVELQGFKIPGISERNVDTSVELQAGQSLALAGLLQSRVESLNKGIPFFADLPAVGRFFSRVEEKTNEVELLVVVTPELVGPLDPHQASDCGPGQLTGSPCDKELYCYGYLEVPNRGAAGPVNGPYPMPVAPGFPTESWPAEAIPSPQAPLPGPAAAPNLEPMEPIPAPTPAAPVTPTRAAVLPVTPPTTSFGGSLQPNALNARRPVLYGPIGYEPLR